jgi:serpin B
MNIRVSVTAVIFLIFASQCGVFADKIHLKTGKILDGKVIDRRESYNPARDFCEDYNDIVVFDNNTYYCVPKDGILRIEKEFRKPEGLALSAKNDKCGSHDNDIKTLVGGNTDFAFAFYGKLKDDPNVTVPKGEPNGNLFFSPYGISTALAMTYGGARGDTEKQMAEAMHFTLPQQRLHPAFSILQKQLIEDEKSRGYQLLLANALWPQKGEPILKEFLDLNKQYYGAGVTLLDFVNETEKSRQIINSWVEEKTKSKIKGLIPPDGVDRATVLVLTNAVYFKGDWKIKFEKSDNKREDFAVSSRDKVTVDMMHIKEDFKYYEDSNFQAIELPYKSDELSMLVILPRKTEGLREIEDGLTAKYLNTLMTKMQKIKIDVYFPKFKMTWGTFCLNKVFVSLGMYDAFGPGADFSGINGMGGIWISDIFHKAFIEVNEEGSEAAAGTAVVIVKSIELPVVFRADHPFIFIIKDNRSGSILFMGRLMNPME